VEEGDCEEMKKIIKNKMILLGVLMLVAAFILIFLIFLKINPARDGAKERGIGESFLDLGNTTCKEFGDNILWTSGYSNTRKGSENYQTWIPETNCTEAGGQNCLLQNISINSRTIYLAPNGMEINGESYIQISNPDNSVCDNPEKGVYSIYLAHESLQGSEGQVEGWYCGKDKDSTSECRTKLTDKFTGNVKCYGIKVWASQDVLIDAFKIKYQWCWDKSYGNKSDEKIGDEKNE
jgi:hypothetical protein